MAIQQDRSTIGAFEAITPFSELLDQVEAGGEIIIAKHGAPAAKLVPVKKEASAKPRAGGIE